MSFTAETPVREIAIERPEAIPLLESLGIDYCCNGGHTLAQACSKRNIPVAAVVTELEKQNTRPQALSWAQMSLGELCTHIIDRHHAYARQQIELIGNLLTKVQQRHGAGHPELFLIGQIFATVAAEIGHHFHCEEDVLFPYITQTEKEPGSAQLPVFQSVEYPVRRMLTEHDQTGEKLSQIREKTNNYQPPADACTTFRALWKAFEDLEKDMHLHVHLENNILFPRALKLTEKQG
ncbi:iron-sulfur cluster repair di-iron protein [Pseudacidobacterium ailaaui]|jgi:regulator of cell morphogenesis and NO signaling|uniref:iron-sulfur cluster repair di-iron protein n=1 Tax=Pseudacidobacterium ailaaui TaxID=1382359 RepID=UPI0006793D91|nr:iron-sulfur cluster repair di-iron protein [Pseudacidobacterium ailaaui]